MVVDNKRKKHNLNTFLELRILFSLIERKKIHIKYLA